MIASWLAPSVVIPVCNEESSLASVVRKLLEILCLLEIAIVEPS